MRSRRLRRPEATGSTRRRVWNTFGLPGGVRSEQVSVKRIAQPPLEVVLGPAGLDSAGAHVEEAIRQVHAAVPDIAFTIEDSVESGDKIWVRVRAQGTATGPYFGPPSGRPVDITVLDVARVVDGRIVEHWGAPDRFALLAQTGVLDRLS